MTNDKDVNLNGGSGFQPNTDNNPNNKPDHTDDPQVKVDGSQPNQPKRDISEGRLRANRANAKKSTGPKTARGKRHSSFNSITHGMLARKVMFSANGKLNEDVHRIFESLREHFRCEDIVTELLVELLATDYWRLQQCLKFEIDDTNSNYAFHPQGISSNLFRYTAMNRRSFEKTLQTLMQMQEKAQRGKADQTYVIQGNSSTEPQAEEDEPEVENLTPQAENAPSARDPSSGLDMGTTEQGVPKCSSKAAGAENSIPAGEIEGAT